MVLDHSITRTGRIFAVGNRFVRGSRPETICEHPSGSELPFRATAGKFGMSAYNGNPSVKPRDQCHVFRADCGISRGICCARLHLVSPQIEARHLRLKVVELKRVCAQPFSTPG